MVGIKDVARHAGVSVGTVSNVINRPEMVSPETQTRVEAAIKILGYVRSESARQLRAGQSRVMALLVLDISNPFFVDMARGAESAAREAGLVVMVCSSAQSVSEEVSHLSLFVEQRVRGVLVSPADPTGSSLETLKQQDTPFVLVDRVAGELGACSVSVDDTVGGALAGRHLVGAGHRSIAYVSGPPHLQQVKDRREGLLQAISEAGLPPETLVEIPTKHLDVANGRDAAARLLGLAQRPTAVFCANDLLALGVLQAVYAAGIAVPQELAIVGYDDIEFASAAVVPLTSVRQPAFEMGRRATELLMEETGEQAAEHRHRKVVMLPELVVRGSSLSRR
ncbi:LacI family DNA-binding transcriptional regulator [Actinomadura opuntiae]|uniref:LacI family DNA-binding transcriptional regulator n=1 Tax=Actinomadura sp. OS1-43 TaxID=604315 RepID=UPI00255ADA61|nr:LacI family DNA-binding transcriptional regulator [Actinomadura sp. OS1-43]MDL4821833.1 LacI family DNA-binding transcriptional regulator [Actinomadura sp. OS1-43]